MPCSAVLSSRVTTDQASLKVFIEDLIKRRKNEVKLFVRAGMVQSPYLLEEAATLQAKVLPIAHGRLGYGMKIDVTQFVANKTDSGIPHSLCRTFGRVTSRKMTVPEENTASRPSGESNATQTPRGCHFQGPETFQIGFHVSDCALEVAQSLEKQQRQYRE